MNDRNKLYAIPSGLDPKIAERIGQYYKDGAFEFEFGTEEIITVEGNTVYHSMPFGPLEYIGGIAIKRLDNSTKTRAGRR